MSVHPETASEILARVAAGEVDGAIEVLERAALPDAVRDRLVEAARETRPAEFATRFALELRGDPANRDAVNECHRAAFYLSGRSRELADNPLYGLFLAGRDGRLVDKWVHYFAVYHRALEKYRGRGPRVLEIGVYKGGGLAMWQEYFSEGASVVGIDVDPAAAGHAPGVPVLIGDQADPAFLERVHREYGPFDVVIDDGGHTMAQQVTSVETLFPLLATGGTYIVEDTHTSYWPEYRDRPETFIDWVKARIDSLHANFDPAGDPDSPWATTVGSICVSDSIVVLTKEARFRPFSEVAGSADFLRQSRIGAARVADLEQQRAEAAQRLTELEGRVSAHPEDEELRVVRAALQDSRKQLAELSGRVQSLEAELVSTQGRLLEAWDHIRGMRHTVSWRLTTPLRLGRVFRR